MPVDLLVLFGLFEVKWIKAFGNEEILAEGLLIRLHGEALTGTDTDHE